MRAENPIPVQEAVRPPNRPGAGIPAGEAAITAGGRGRSAPRADIQGLRAVAVLMVLLYHARIPFVSGGFAGVDVFFVISGFLITGLMVRELERTGRLSLPSFWARRARRLLPATALVLAAVSVLTVLLLPQVRWSVTAGDIVAAAFYVINWRLASQSLDYLAQNYAASPVQHFWSLAVEEQFYVIWPVLIVLMAALARRRVWPLRRTLLAGVLAIAVPSLIWSIHLGAGTPSAYFVTTTRAWELGVGAVVALVAVRLRSLGRRLAQALTGAGVLTLIAVALWLPDTLPWPGSAALIPTLATAAVIGAGPAAGAGGAALVLGLRPLQWIGDLSYSLYLWHWPLIVLATAHWENTLTPIHGLLVVAASTVPALLTYRLVESPLHHARFLSGAPWRALTLGAACTAIGLLAGFGLQSAVPGYQAVPAAQRPGAAALRTSPQTAIPRLGTSSITPDPLHAREDLPDLYARKCQDDYVESDVRPCRFGNTVGGSGTVVLIGDSRAAQWSPTLQVLAGQQHWRLITLTKAGCPFADVQIVKGSRGHELAYTSCTDWNDGVRAWLRADPPDLVVTSAFYPYVTSIKGKVQAGPANHQALVDGYHRTWAGLNKTRIPVIALRETPVMGRDVAECVSQHRKALHRCGTLRRKALRTAHILQPAATGLTRSVTVDLTRPGVCPAKVCPAVIGNVLIYRDEHHLTATYARTLAPLLHDTLVGLRKKQFAQGALDQLLPAG